MLPRRLVVLFLFAVSCGRSSVEDSESSGLTASTSSRGEGTTYASCDVNHGATTAIFISGDATCNGTHETEELQVTTWGITLTAGSTVTLTTPTSKVGLNAGRCPIAVPCTMATDGTLHVDVEDAEHLEGTFDFGFPEGRRSGRFWLARCESHGHTLC